MATTDCILENTYFMQYLLDIAMAERGMELVLLLAVVGRCPTTTVAEEVLAPCNQRLSQCCAYVDNERNARITPQP